MISTARVASAACWIAATGPSFGAYDPLASSPVDAAGQIQYLCTSPARVAISAGTSGNFASRTMQSGGAILTYNLYTDAARTQVWGDGTGGSSAPTVAGFFQSVPIYGRVPGRQDVGTGSYSDSLVVTFIF
jgi:spore coat protein U-like protein